MTTTKYIQIAEIKCTESTQHQQREKTTILDQNAYKAALTDFAISKWPYRIDELMFFMILRQKLASATAQIICIDDLFKELSPACNLNTSSLRMHVQVIGTIL